MGVFSDGVAIWVLTGVGALLLRDFLFLLLAVLLAGYPGAELLVPVFPFER